MGQRHQIYLAFKPGDSNVYGDVEGEPKKPTIVIGAHHQWLYGQYAVMQASRMMQLVEKIPQCGEYSHNNPFYDKVRALKTLEAIYTLIPEDGYMSNIILFEGDNDNEEKNDPRRGDNNDGITVFDFRDLKNPAYCFMKLPNMGDKAVSKLTTGNPVSAETYLRAYYSLKRSDPLGGYEKYALENSKNLKKTKKYLKRLRVENVAALKPLLKSKVMKKAAMKEIFPNMYALGKLKKN
jgi:hypothetical protein